MVRQWKNTGEPGEVETRIHKETFMMTPKNAPSVVTATPEQIMSLCCMLPFEFYPEWRALPAQRRQKIAEEIGALLPAEERKK